MNRIAALAILAATAASLALILALPWPLVAGALALALVAVPATGRTVAIAALFTFPLHLILFAAIVRGGPQAMLGPIQLSLDGAFVGAQAALRLVTLTAVALAWLEAFPAPRLLSALRLPPRLAGTLGALLLSAHGVREDWRNLILARRADHTWPEHRWRQIKAASELVPSLVAAALRRAATRRDALRMAGHDTGPLFVPLVAFGALALAGRLLFLALPNIALTYLVVFLAGILFGARAGALVAILSMGFSNLLLTGLLPAPFVNLPAMALLGVLGGLLRGVPWGESRTAARVAATAIGIAATLLFSVATDVGSWFLLPELRNQQGTLVPLIAAGLAFNALPAAVNGALFAVAVPATVRALRVATPVASAR
ncbi:MAG: hypothetical protein AABX89_06740 [Candidatus Thermoplasmatota archaeon]